MFTRTTGRRPLLPAAQGESLASRLFMVLAIAALFLAPLLGDHLDPNGPAAHVLPAAELPQPATPQRPQPRRIAFVDERIERYARQACRDLLGAAASHAWGPQSRLLCTAGATSTPSPIQPRRKQAKAHTEGSRA